MVTKLVFASVSYEALFSKSVANSSGVFFLNEIFMCLTCIRPGFSRNKFMFFFCMKSHKNVLGHTNCYTVKLNRHTDKVLLITFLQIISV
jgi:hypothetical protein